MASNVQLAALAILGRQHHGHRAQLFGGQAFEPAQPDGLGDQDRVLAVHPRGQQTFVGGLVLGQEAGLGEHLADAAQLARVLVHLLAGLPLPGLELALQLADLPVVAQVLAEARAADDLQFALALEQALGLYLQVLEVAPGHAQRARPPPPPPPALGPRLPAQPAHLDPDRPPAVLDLVVLGHVRDRALVPFQS